MTRHRFPFSRKQRQFTRSRIMSAFTWQRAAEASLAGYRAALATTR